MKKVARISSTAIFLSCVLLSGCSLFRTNPGVAGIQGIWRYSEGDGINWVRYSTYEFAGNHFRTYGSPRYMAYGRYQASSVQDNVFQLRLKLVHQDNYDLENLQVSPVEKGLLINNRLYRRIVRQ